MPVSLDFPSAAAVPLVVDRRSRTGARDGANGSGSPEALDFTERLWRCYAVEAWPEADESRRAVSAGQECRSRSVEALECYLLRRLEV